eukprot:maker-scaffold470_size172058-snap-gene-0.29 protein:Tk09900 transcript:maker-scaffold470_size172058-snap-gene-0.29-mRNA-1 annotation:"hypothetical protein"
MNPSKHPPALQTGSRDRKREPPNFRVPDLGNYHRLLVGKHTPISMDTSDWGEASNLSRLRLNAILMAPLPKYLDEESVYDEVNNGLAVNPAKTQLMVGGIIKAKDLSSLSLMVDGIMVSPTQEIGLLG